MRRRHHKPRKLRKVCGFVVRPGMPANAVRVSGNIARTSRRLAGYLNSLTPRLAAEVALWQAGDQEDALAADLQALRRSIKPLLDLITKQEAQEQMHEYLTERLPLWRITQQALAEDFWDFAHVMKHGN